MHKKTAAILGLIVMVTMVLSACTTPTAPPPQVIKETVVVKETALVTVKETQVVKETSVVEVTQAAGEKGIVEFSGFYPKDASYGRWFNNLGFRLEAENPECDFVYTEAPGIEGQKAMTLRIQEGDPPTLGCSAVPGAPGGGELVKAGLVYDLAKDMASPSYAGDGTWYDSFTVAAQTMMSDFPGGMKALVPYEPTNLVLWYNTAIYEQYGLSAPTTWSELMANCEAIKTQSNGEIACIGGGGWPGYVTYWFDGIMHGMVGPDKKNMWFGPNLEDPSKAIKYTDAAPMAAAKLLKEAYDNDYMASGFLSGDFTLNQVAYFTGKVAHLYVGTWLMGEMKDVVPADFKQMITYFPSIDGYTQTHEWVSGTINSFAICNPGAKSKPTYSTACAVKYMKLMTSPEVAADFVSAQGSFSSVKGAPGPVSMPGSTEVMGNMKEWSQNTDNIYAYCTEVFTVVTDELVKYLDGTQSLDDFAANAEQLSGESWARCIEKAK